MVIYEVGHGVAYMCVYAYIIYVCVCMSVCVYVHNTCFKGCCITCVLKHVQ